ncbi:unnamed protein product [Diabrotica balteata]|uniref:Uncharacterized protein n=1 Tax=Diabrotica balteata TaxID=107213 RepID=A0A9N9XCB8_DIABA|nr:unnamed protein product [Diabrotica balteata]
MCSNKILLVSISLLSCFYFAHAQITNAEVNDLKAAWHVYNKDPIKYATDLVTTVVDHVIVPLAKENLKLLDFVLSAEAREKVLAALPKLKEIVNVELFKTLVVDGAKIINMSIDALVDTLVSVLNSLEASLKKYLGIILDIIIQIGDEALGKLTILAEQHMKGSFTDAQIKAVQKVIRTIDSIDKDMIVRVLRSIR